MKILAVGKDGGRRESSDEKALMVLPLAFSGLRKVETSAAFLKNFESDLIKDMLDLWVDCFHNYQDGPGVAYFDNMAFSAAVSEELTTRRVKPEVMQEVRRCVIM